VVKPQITKLAMCWYFISELIAKSMPDNLAIPAFVVFGALLLVVNIIAWGDDLI